MLEVEPLEDILELTLQSGHIKDERPLSLIIIANAESGKTEVMKEFRYNDGIVYLTDCTAHGITKEVLPKIENGAVTHIMIPDLLKPLSRNKATVNNLITFFNALIEEGVADISTYAQGMTHRVNDLRCGLITSITRDAFGDKRHRWSSIGFLSRALCFSYSYDQNKVRKIMNYIISQKHLEETEIKLKFPKKLVDIELSKSLANRVQPFSYAFGQAARVYGFRFQKQLQAMMKANAYLNGRKQCTLADYKKVEYLMNWMNLDFKPL